MALGIYEEEDIREIAKSIRNNLGNDTKYTVGQMPSAINEIQTYAYNNGHSEGKTEAYAEVEAINAELEQTLYGTDTGGKSFYDEFWDECQQNGNRNNYRNAFAGAGWTSKNFKPKYDIQPTSDGAYMMFYFSEVSGDLVQILEDCGVDLDLSKCTGWIQYTFTGSKITRIGRLDCSNAAALASVFGTATLIAIDELIVSATNTFQGAFIGGVNLETLIVRGEIGKDGFDVQMCPKLSHESLMSIINALKDNSGTETWNSIALGADNLAKLSQDELDIMERKQWEYT